MLVRRRTAIAELRARIPSLPASLDGCWAAVRIERPGSYDIGPANLEIVMWFPVRDDDAPGDEPTWAMVDREVGPIGDAGEVTINAEALAAVLPGRFDPPAWGSAHVRVAGRLYDARCFEGGGFGTGRAVRIEGGLVVAIATMPPRAAIATAAP